MSERHSAEDVRIAEPCAEDKHNTAYAVGLGWYCPHCLSRLVLSQWYRPTGYALIDGEVGDRGEPQQG
jgi:hypothetical protein